MGDVIGQMLTIIFGLFLILALLFALKFVHQQQKRLKQLEDEMNASDALEAAAARNNQED